MAIEFKCNCGSEYRLDDSRAGQEFICKVCRAQVHLPAGTPRVVPPSEARDPQSARGELAAGSGVAGQSTAAGACAPAAGRGADAAPPGRTRAAPPAQRRQTEPRQTSAQRQPSQQAPAVLTGPDAVATEPDIQTMRWAAPRPEDLAGSGPGFWWLFRRVLLWAGCVAFLAAPWFTCPRAGNDDAMDGRSLTGWQIIRISTEGLVSDVRRRHAGLNVILASFTDRGVVPTTPGVVVGAMCMSFSPLVYGLAVLLFPVAAMVAKRRGARWLHVPFLVCWLGLLCYLIGWLLLGHAVPSGRGSPLAFGVSIWVYVMLLGLVPMTLLARWRPVAPAETFVVRKSDAPPT